MYKLDKKIVEKKYKGMLSVRKLNLDVNFTTKESINAVAENQDLLKQLHGCGFSFVKCVADDCCEQEKCTKNIESNGIKKTASSKKEKQVLPKASKEK